MHSKRFSFFCLPDEIIMYLKNLTSYSDLTLCAEVSDDGSRPAILSKLTVDNISFGQNQIIWILPEHIDEPKFSIPSFYDTIQIVMPILSDKELSMSSIAIKTSEEISKSKPAIKLYKKFKNFISRKTFPGIWGVNRSICGESYYKDIRISQLSIDCFNSGVKLIHDKSVKNVIFEYRI